MVKDDTVYLQHVLDAITTIEEYLSGVDEDKFRTTRLLQDGVIRQFAKHTLKSPGRILQECGIS